MAHFLDFGFVATQYARCDLRNSKIKKNLPLLAARHSAAALCSTGQMLRPHVN
jgi:hypothetical protein